MTETITRHLRITGHVQGVFFRDWTVQAAERLGLTGWVRNTADGAVEALATGPADRVEAFVQRCHDGPERARVDAVAVREAGDEGLDRFERRRSAQGSEP